MVRKCILCSKLLGCFKGDVAYECETCRLADDCSIQLYFTTTHISYEQCSSCRKSPFGQKRDLSELRAWSAA